MSWFDQMARSAPSIPTPPGSQALSAVTGGPQAANGMAGMFSGGAPAGPNSVLGLMGAGSLASLGGGQAGPNGPGGAMAWMQDPSAQPALGHALMGGTQILNTGSDWTAGSPMPPGRFMPSPSFQDGPQPVPGQPPQKFDPSQGQQPMPIDPGMGHTVNGSDPIWPGGPSWDQLKQQNGGFLYGGNRGSGQPINQPMATSQPLPWDGSGGESSMGGSLQSLGGGQLNQSGMVTLRAPDGSQTKAVPADQVAHWLSRGAVRV